jgi:hypothetical protein
MVPVLMIVCVLLIIGFAYRLVAAEKNQQLALARHAVGHPKHLRDDPLWVYRFWVRWYVMWIVLDMAALVWLILKGP